MIGFSKLAIEQIANVLKGAATSELLVRGLHPFATSGKREGRTPSPWARHQWSRFLSTPADIQWCIRYVEDNPLKEGKPYQRWRFVVPYLA